MRISIVEEVIGLAIHGRTPKANRHGIGFNTVIETSTWDGGSRGVQPITEGDIQVCRHLFLRGKSVFLWERRTLIHVLDRSEPLVARRPDASKV